MKAWIDVVYFTGYAYRNIDNEPAIQSEGIADVLPVTWPDSLYRLTIVI